MGSPSAINRQNPCESTTNILTQMTVLQACIAATIIKAIQNYKRSKGKNS